MPFGLSQNFWALVAEIFPLFVTALVLSLIFGCKRLRDSYKEDNILSWLIQYCITAVMTAVFAISMILLLPVIFPEMSYEVKFGVVLYICVFGIKTFQAVIRKKLGIVEVNKKDLGKL